MSTYELTPEQKIRQRCAWFQEAQRLGNVKLACLRLGISRNTFYKWKNRFTQAKGDRSALLDRSRRPHHPHYRVKKSLRRRLIPPHTPRLNGKVERNHQTDEEEFYRLRPYSTQKDLQRDFARWLWHYNHTGLHMQLNGKTPIPVPSGFPKIRPHQSTEVSPMLTIWTLFRHRISAQDLVFFWGLFKGNFWRY